MKKRVGVITYLLAAAACAAEPEILDVNVELTDKHGRAHLEQPIGVRNESTTIAGALVYQIHGFNNSYLTLGLDLNENPLPERHEIGYLPAEAGRRRSSLLPEVVLFLQTARAVDYARKDAQKQRRQFMGETRNVNRYCVNLEQMTETSIRVPMGLIGVASEEIKIRTSAPLERLFEKYVVKKYGRQPGYEVWVPKTAINLCGEDFQGVICPIDRETLSEALWMHANMPVWEIKGACDPTKFYRR